MKHFISYFLFISLFFSCNVFANSWTLKRESQGVRIYQQPSTFGHATTRGMMEVDSTIDAMLSIMRDNEACPKWLYACLTSHNVFTKSPSERLDYAVIKSPVFFANRDMYIYSISEYDKSTQTVTIKNSGHENYDKGQANRVRIKSIQAFWQFKKISPNKISVLYQISSDPQIIRSSYLDLYIAESVFQTLINLSHTAKQAPYAQAKIDELN